MSVGRIKIGIFSLLAVCAVTWGGDSADRDRTILLQDGRHLCYRELGNPDGRLVLYFHGTNSSRIEVDFIRSAVEASGLRVVAVDRPGHGGSTFLPERTICSWVSDVQELTAALGYGGRRFGIFAESGGAPYGCVCAAKIPHRISHLALVSGYAPHDAPGVKRGVMNATIELVANCPNVGRLTVLRNDRRIHRNPQSVLKSFSFRWAEVDRKLILEDEWTNRVAIENLKAAWCQGPDGPVQDVGLMKNHWGFEPGEIKNVSVSVWSGLADTVVTPSMAHYYHQTIRGSSLTLGPGEGHATMSQNYAARILRRF